MEDQERIRQDWGSYEPEVQKALRFVAMTGGTGTAKQMAKAIDREYAKRNKGQSEQKRPIKPPRRPKQMLSENELKVLRIATNGAQVGGFTLEQSLYISELEDKEFYRCIDTLVEQKYLGGDVFTGFYRTKKPFPKPTEDDIDASIAAFQARHPEIDEKQIELMRRIHLYMRKHEPGWTF